MGGKSIVQGQSSEPQVLQHVLLCAWGAAGGGGGLPVPGPSEAAERPEATVQAQHLGLLLSPQGATSSFGRPGGRRVKGKQRQWVAT